MLPGPEARYAFAAQEIVQTGQGCQIWPSTANLAELEGGWPWNFSALGQPQIWPNLAEFIRRIYINMKIYIGIHAHKILKILRSQFKIHIYRSILTVCT